MSFLPDVVTACATCGGKRFDPRTLDVKYMGLSIGDVLDLTPRKPASSSRITRASPAPLVTLTDLGAGYIHLGQGSHTLSGGGGPATQAGRGADRDGSDTCPRSTCSTSRPRAST